MGETEILEGLTQAVINGDVDKAKDLAQQALEANIDPTEAIEEGLLKGIKVVGEAFGRGETFLPDLVLAGEALKEGSAILQKEIEKKGARINYSGKLLIGTVAGDIHDIGKALVATMYRASGFEVKDLGTDVPAQKFVDETRAFSPDILALSALLTATAIGQKTVIEALKEAGLRDEVKVLVGGGAVTREWADEIGADGFAIDAASAVQLGLDMMKQK